MQNTETVKARDLQPNDQYVGSSGIIYPVVDVIVTEEQVSITLAHPDKPEETAIMTFYSNPDMKRIKK